MLLHPGCQTLFDGGNEGIHRFTGSTHLDRSRTICCVADTHWPTCLPFSTSRPDPALSSSISPMAQLRCTLPEWIPLRRASARRWGGILSNIEDVDLNTPALRISTPERPSDHDFFDDRCSQKGNEGVLSWSIPTGCVRSGYSLRVEGVGDHSCGGIAFHHKYVQFPQIGIRDMISQEPCHYQDQLSLSYSRVLGCGPNM